METKKTNKKLVIKMPIYIYRDTGTNCVVFNLNPNDEESKSFSVKFIKTNSYINMTPDIESFNKIVVYYILNKRALKVSDYNSYLKTFYNYAGLKKLI